MKAGKEESQEETEGWEGQGKAQIKALEEEEEGVSSFEQHIRLTAQSSRVLDCAPAATAAAQPSAQSHVTMATCGPASVLERVEVTAAICVRSVWLIMWGMK